MGALGVLGLGVLLAWLPPAPAETFSAMLSIRQALGAEGRLLRLLRAYLQQESDRLSDLARAPDRLRGAAAGAAGAGGPGRGGPGAHAAAGRLRAERQGLGQGRLRARWRPLAPLPPRPAHRPLRRRLLPRGQGGLRHGRLLPLHCVAGGGRRPLPPLLRELEHRGPGQPGGRPGPPGLLLLHGGKRLARLEPLQGASALRPRQPQGGQERGAVREAAGGAGGPRGAGTAAAPRQHPPADPRRLRGAVPAPGDAAPAAEPPLRLRDPRQPLPAAPAGQEGDGPAAALRRPVPRLRQRRRGRDRQGAGGALAAAVRGRLRRGAAKSRVPDQQERLAEGHGRPGGGGTGAAHRRRHRPGRAGALRRVPAGGQLRAGRPLRAPLRPRHPELGGGRRLHCLHLRQLQRARRQERSAVLVEPAAERRGRRGHAARRLPRPGRRQVGGQQVDPRARAGVSAAVRPPP
ncbi:prolyl 4-hydroxylase subunit alpha-3 isoform X5 [Dromaius novaehollandiae]|uniref:prolyl 4-hydroxylase subunit alpha-3 isoform X5 n=1 Tax=Dromaius novaehollandiae TaxID=8790 RepID=UPI00311E3EB7